MMSRRSCRSAPISRWYGWQQQPRSGSASRSSPSTRRRTGTPCAPTASRTGSKASVDCWQNSEGRSLAGRGGLPRPQQQSGCAASAERGNDVLCEQLHLAHLLVERHEALVEEPAEPFELAVAADPV